MQWEEFGSYVRHLTNGDREAVRKAFDMGERAHALQRRESGEPYFSHPIAVSRILAGLGADRDTIIAGLLHDSVEDTPVTLADIKREFGRTVGMLIDGVTKLERIDLVGKPNMNEQIETLRKMFTLMQQDVRIMIIKLADRLHNMQTIQFRPPMKQTAVARETMDVYVKVADRLCMRELRDELESLSLSVLEPELFPKLVRVRENNHELAVKCIKAMETKLLAGYPSLRVSFESEAKSWQKLRQQMEVEGEDPTGLFGVSLAVVCTDVQSCYVALGALHQSWHREALTFEDYINDPVINGYKGLHTSVIMDRGVRVRCKIRTPEMQRYAERGITLRCFDNSALGVSSYLPWGDNVAAIAADTMYHSQEFWENLQSDILQDSIMIYGPEGRSFMVPRGSTALDGAFFLFREQANHVETIRLNGKKVGLSHPLEYAATLEVEFADNPTVQRAWLQTVQTGVAVALIRQQLASAPREAKIELGRDLLDLALQKSNRIRLDELAPEHLQSYLSDFGVATYSELLEKIAEGNFDAPEVATKLFSHGRRKVGLFPSSDWVLHADIPHALEDKVFLLVRAFPNARIAFEHNVDSSHLTIHLSLTSTQVQDLERALNDLLPHDVWTLRGARSNRVLVVACGVLVTLWGLDPVVGRSILLGDVTAYDLTFIRAITFFVASSLMYGAQLFMMGRRLKWLNPLNPTLIAGGAALFVTALFSYLSLQGIAATEYILLIVAGLLMTMLLQQILRSQRWKSTVASLLIVIGGIVLTAQLMGFSTFTLLAGIGASFGFSLYSELSRRYQQSEAPIRARYPAYLFWLSCVGLALSGFILPYADIGAVHPWDLAKTIVFVLVFSVLPYSMYFEITRRFDSKLLDRAVPLITIVTIVGELLMLQSVAPLFSLPIIIVFLWHFYAGRKSY